jgi:hypothetical protein
MRARFEGRDVSTGLVSGVAASSWSHLCTIQVTVAMLPMSAGPVVLDGTTLSYSVK